MSRSNLNLTQEDLSPRRCTNTDRAILVFRVMVRWSMAISIVGAVEQLDQFYEIQSIQVILLC